jgi:dTDP-4-amino-4,6-dideoxygalactose transaminase
MKTDVPLLDLEPIHGALRDSLDEAVLRVLHSNRFIGGQEVEGLEREIADYCGTACAVGVSSGTDALIVCLMALGVGPGDEVIVPSFTFFATAGSVQRVGARPVFCDVERESLNVAPDSLRSCLTERTKAVIPVHLFGQCADMDPILEMCAKHRVAVIEDAAQAIGARYHDRMAGSMGEFGCLSFFPSKNLGGIGDGGLVLTQDPKFAELVRCLRDHGAVQRYYHKLVGGNFRLDAIQAAALRVKLDHIESWHAMRNQNAEAYGEGLADLAARGDVRLPVILPGMRHVFNQYVIRVAQRDELQRHLSECGIGTAIYYPVPLHLQECFASSGYPEGSLSESEAAAREVLALPIFPGLTEQQRDWVIASIRSFFG